MYVLINWQILRSGKEKHYSALLKKEFYVQGLRKQTKRPIAEEQKVCNWY